MTFSEQERERDKFNRMISMEKKDKDEELVNVREEVRGGQSNLQC